MLNQCAGSMINGYAFSGLFTAILKDLSARRRAYLTRHEMGDFSLACGGSIARQATIVIMARQYPPRYPIPSTAVPRSCACQDSQWISRSIRASHKTPALMSTTKLNLTLSLDKEIIRRAKILAAQRSVLVSRVAADEITRLVEDEGAYEYASAML
jgi:hypothetical protein